MPRHRPGLSRPSTSSGPLRRGCPAQAPRHRRIPTLRSRSARDDDCARLSHAPRSQTAPGSCSRSSSCSRRGCGSICARWSPGSSTVIAWDRLKARLAARDRAAAALPDAARLPDPVRSCCFRSSCSGCGCWRTAHGSARCRAGARQGRRPRRHGVHLRRDAAEAAAACLVPLALRATCWSGSTRRTR